MTRQALVPESGLSHSFALRLALGALALCVGCASATAGGLRPFAADGCSMFVDGTPAQRDLWKHCCILHDKAYWRGGTREERKEADRRFRSCVDEVGDAALAEIMYRGVRAGGGPHWPTSYRWGYGWPYGRGYRPLSEAEQAMADRILAESEAADAAETNAERVTSEQP